MNEEQPFGGNAPGSGNDAPYAWLDEWLCEYVDGTMDPSLETVFEQYVQANPELRAHVKRLRETRELLCNCGLSGEEERAPAGEGRRDPSAEDPSAQRPSPESGSSVVTSTIGIVSCVSVALVVGFLAGATFVGSGPSSQTTSAREGSARYGADPGPQTRIERTVPQSPRETALLGGTPFDPIELDTVQQQRPVSGVTFP